MHVWDCKARAILTFSHVGTAGWVELYEVFERFGLSLSMVLECLDPTAISKELVRENILTSTEWQQILRRASKGKTRLSWFLADKVARKRLKYKERLASLVVRIDVQFVEQSKKHWAGPERKLCSYCRLFSSKVSTAWQSSESHRDDQKIDS